MPLSLMPKDLPLPVASDNGGFVPANAVDTSQSGPDGLVAYDPWTHANLAKMADQSQPEEVDGEPSYAKAASIVAEWGGMPSPVQDYQNMAGSVAFVRGTNKTLGVTGPNGRFDGPAQTANDLAYVDPATDYWSTVIGG